MLKQINPGICRDPTAPIEGASMLDETYLASLLGLVPDQRFRITLRDDAFGSMAALLYLDNTCVIDQPVHEAQFLAGMRSAGLTSPGPWVIIPGHNWDAQEFWRKMGSYIETLELLKPPSEDEHPDHPPD